VESEDALIVEGSFNGVASLAVCGEASDLEAEQAMETAIINTIIKRTDFMISIMP
jgi:hypothetical protein